MNNIGYRIFLKSGKPNFYVQFKINNTWTSQKSLKTADRATAERIAREWLVNGKDGKDGKERPENNALIKQIKNTNLNIEDTRKLCEILKEKGVLHSYTLNTEKDTIKAYDFLLEQWQNADSDFLLSRKGKGANHITQATQKNNVCRIKKYWRDILGNTLLNDIDLQKYNHFKTQIKKLNVYESTKNNIFQSAHTVFLWGYSIGLIQNDFAKRVKNDFSAKNKEKAIFDAPTLSRLFNSEWTNPKIKLLCSLLCCTGARIGELLALKESDIDYKNALISISHSYSLIDGLKNTKTGVNRIVTIPYQWQADALHADNFARNGYIFESIETAKPYTENAILRAFRTQLKKIGLSDTECKMYNLHTFRHFFTSIISRSANMEILARNNGHSAQEIESRYANHRIESDFDTLRQIEKQTFSAIF